MTTTFKINSFHQLRSLRQCFSTLVWTVVGYIAGLLFLKYIANQTWMVICILFWLVTTLLMLLPFHINYVIVNWNTRLIIDHELEQITIIESGKSFQYKISEITVTRHLLGHHKPGRIKSWRLAPFDYYGYLMVDTGDNKEFYFTSLMLDPFNPPLPIHDDEYGFPIIWK